MAKYNNPPTSLRSRGMVADQRGRNNLEQWQAPENPSEYTETGNAKTTTDNDYRNPTRPEPLQKDVPVLHRNFVFEPKEPCQRNKTDKKRNKTSPAEKHDKVLVIRRKLPKMREEVRDGDPHSLSIRRNFQKSRVKFSFVHLEKPPVYIWQTICLLINTIRPPMSRAERGFYIKIFLIAS